MEQERMEQNYEFINFEDAFGTGMCEVVVAYPGTTSVDSNANSYNSTGNALSTLENHLEVSDNDA